MTPLHLQIAAAQCCALLMLLLKQASAAGSTDVNTPGVLPSRANGNDWQNLGLPAEVTQAGRWKIDWGASDNFGASSDACAPRKCCPALLFNPAVLCFFSFFLPFLS